jgi:hypothetical protein
LLMKKPIVRGRTGMYQHVKSSLQIKYFYIWETESQVGHLICQFRHPKYSGLAGDASSVNITVK